MLRVIFLVVVALFGSLALGLAWLSRNERTAMIVFGTVGLACWALVLTAISVRAPWVTWTLATVAALGLIIVFWGLLMATAIVNQFDAMRVRHAEPGQTFRMNSKARLFRIGELDLRLNKIDTEGPDDRVVTLTATILDARSDLVLRKGPSTDGTSAVVSGYRVQLVNVSTADANKVALYSAHLVVNRVAAP